jgi:hypothetical protein
MARREISQITTLSAVPAKRSGPRAWAAVRALAVLVVCGVGFAAAVALLKAPSRAGSRGTPAAGAHAGPRSELESMFQDDRYLIYNSTATVTRTLNVLRALGVDRLRLTILWSAIAPAASATRPPPGFDAADPAAYPARSWGPYDRVLELARARGIGVDFDVTAPGPVWAMGPGAARAKQATHYEPSATAFGRFVLALGRRYSGSYVPPGAAGALPRVDYWSIWNEPNQPGWLAPQWRTVGRRPELEAARLYRGLVDAAVASLDRSGHRADTILIGELAPEGGQRIGGDQPVAPIPFLEALYCVDSAYRPLAGAAARVLGCPAGEAGEAGGRAAFVTAHPGLFQATGFAHHPYSFFLAPAAQMSDPKFVPLADLGRLEHGLDRIFAAYAVDRRLPLYLTEYGYETNPPNPFRGVSPATQAAYLDQAEYLAWIDPRVRVLSQFLLYDSPPDRAYRRGSVRYWSTFQTGLAYLDGAPKPALSAYRLPIFIPAPAFAPGSEVTVWGMLRLAPNDTAQRASIQWRPARPGATYQTLATVQTHDPSGVLVARVSPPGTGLVRIAWTSPSGAVAYSRVAPVTG